MDQIISWLLGNKSLDPLVRFGRLSLVLFAVAATIISFSAGHLERLVFVAIFVLGFALALWAASEVMKAESRTFALLGRAVAIAMLVAVSGLFVATVSYLIAGVPQGIGRIFGAASANTVAIKDVFFVLDGRQIGPMTVAIEEHSTFGDLVARAKSMLPTADTSKMPQDCRVWDSDSKKYFDSTLQAKRLLYSAQPVLISALESPQTEFARQGEVLSKPTVPGSQATLPSSLLKTTSDVVVEQQARESTAKVTVEPYVLDRWEAALATSRGWHFIIMNGGTSGGRVSGPISFGDFRTVAAPLRPSKTGARWEEIQSVAGFFDSLLTASPYLTNAFSGRRAFVYILSKEDAWEVLDKAPKRIQELARARLFGDAVFIISDVANKVFVMDVLKSYVRELVCEKMDFRVAAFPEAAARASRFLLTFDVQEECSGSFNLFAPPDTESEDKERSYYPRRQTFRGPGWLWRRAVQGFSGEKTKWTESGFVYPVLDEFNYERNYNVGCKGYGMHGALMVEMLSKYKWLVRLPEGIRNAEIFGCPPSSAIAKLDAFLIDRVNYVFVIPRERTVTLNSLSENIYRYE